MFAALLMLIATTALVIGSLAWSSWRDRRQARALAVQADIQWVINRQLGGESLVAVTVTPPTSWRRGRVVLWAPPDWDGLLGRLWNAVIREVPDGYELVVPGRMGARTRVLTTALARRAA